MAEVSPYKTILYTTSVSASLLTMVKIDCFMLCPFEVMLRHIVGCKAERLDLFLQILKTLFCCVFYEQYLPLFLGDIKNVGGFWGSIKCERKIGARDISLTHTFATATMDLGKILSAGAETNKLHILQENALGGYGQNIILRVTIIIIENYLGCNRCHILSLCL